MPSSTTTRQSAASDCSEAALTVGSGGGEWRLAESNLRGLSSHPECASDVGPGSPGRSGLTHGCPELGLGLFNTSLCETDPTKLARVIGRS